MMPKIGIMKAERPRRPVSRITIGDWRLYFLRKASSAFMPPMVPKMHQLPIQIA